jgi:MFS family permease
MTGDPREGAAKRRVLRTVFCVLFLDIIGFSIIFPLYPAVLDHYIALQGNEGVLGAMIAGLERFGESAGMSGDNLVVLFGGVLGAAYAFLQFLFAPVAGSLSDRFGRRPVLLVSVAGMFVSYALWVVAGRFWILLVARILGGIMSSNVSTASAVIADVTGEEARTRGMALVGIAFGVGMTLGPALGGVAALVDPSAVWPSLARWGVNPFSLPAVAAALMAAGNFVLVWRGLPETRRPSDRAGAQTPGARMAAFVRLSTAPGFSRVNMVNLLFMVAFTGAQFAITFLAADRFGFGPFENALMLVYMGVMLAAVQGAYVRPFSQRIGPRPMAMHGLLCAVPALALVGTARSLWVLVPGLTLMSAGASMVFPCLAALASLYAPEDRQGTALGTFRSIGALARVIGPLAVCMLYWRAGGTLTYWVAAAALLVPLALLAVLPPRVAPDPA